MFAAGESVVHSEGRVAALISCRAKLTAYFAVRLVPRSGVEFVHFPPSVPMAPQPVKAPEPIRFGEDFELDLAARRLRRGNRVLKVERIPLEIMVLLYLALG